MASQCFIWVWVWYRLGFLNTLINFFNFLDLMVLWDHQTPPNPWGTHWMTWTNIVVTELAQCFQCHPTPSGRGNWWRVSGVQKVLNWTKNKYSSCWNCIRYECLWLALLTPQGYDWWVCGFQCVYVKCIHATVHVCMNPWYWLWSGSSGSKDTAESQPQGWTNRERPRPTMYH